jgi:hypothetical protein
MKCALIFLLGVLIIESCKENRPKDIVLIAKDISGYVQKGPFVNGSTITISELDLKMNPTGKIFNTEILDNQGSFELKGIELVSQYVEIKADGYYYNEVLGENSSAPLKLSALADLSNRENVNVNVLSHLEKSRAIYLIGNQGYSFAKAKKQAMQEILAMLSIEKNDIVASENLNITQSGEDNAILLAASVILQGERTTSEFSELLENINTDLREDGILNNATSQKALIGPLKYMDLSQIRMNLERKYQDLGFQIDVPDFEKYVLMFLENTTFDDPQTLLFPEKGAHGINILHPDVLEVKCFRETESEYSMAADIPLNASLKVKITALHMFKPFGVAFGNISNWEIYDYNIDEESQIYKVIEGGKPSDLRMRFYEGEYRIDYYENNSSEPTFVKTLKVTFIVNALPVSGKYGANIIHPAVSHININEECSICAHISKGETLAIELMNQHTGMISWITSDIENWKMTELPYGIQAFYVIESGKPSDVKVRLESGKYTVNVSYNRVKTSKKLWVGMD